MAEVHQSATPDVKTFVSAPLCKNCGGTMRMLSAEIAALIQNDKDRWYCPVCDRDKEMEQVVDPCVFWG